MIFKSSVYLVLLLGPFLSVGFSQSIRPTGVERSLNHDGVSRKFRIYVPAAAADSGGGVPVVFCLHGGGSDAATISKSGWTTMAEKESFIAVYPEGLNRHWNDGRKVRKHAAQDAETDDVAFVMRLLDKLIEEQPVDPDRVYLVGLSNGGFMVQRLANEQTERFAAIAVHIASLPTNYVTGPLEFSPSAPLSVLFMNGTEDTFMPFAGGKLTPNMTPRLIDSETFDFGQDSAVPTMEAVNLWVTHNQIDPAAKTVTEIPDQDPDDGCRVILHQWKRQAGNIAVELYEVVGGGHTVPGGTQYLPEHIIGPVCKDLNGIESTWTFFQSRRR